MCFLLPCMAATVTEALRSPRLVLAIVLLQGSSQKLGEQGIFTVVICSKEKDAPWGIPVSLLNLEYRTFCLMRES